MLIKNAYLQNSLKIIKFIRIKEMKERKREGDRQVDREFLKINNLVSH